VSVPKVCSNAGASGQQQQLKLKGYLGGGGGENGKGDQSFMAFPMEFVRDKWMECARRSTD